MNGNNEQVLSDKQQSVDDRLDPLRPVFTSNHSGFGFADSDTLYTPSPDGKEAFGSGFMGVFQPESKHSSSSNSTRQINAKQQHDKNKKRSDFRSPPSPGTMIRTIKNKFNSLPELPESLPKLQPEVLQRIKEHEANKRAGRKSSSPNIKHRQTTAEKRPAKQRPFAEKRPALVENSSQLKTKEMPPSSTEYQPEKAKQNKNRIKNNANDKGKASSTVDDIENNDEVFQANSSPENKSNTSRKETRRRSSSTKENIKNQNKKSRGSIKRTQSASPPNTRPNKRQRTEYNNTVSMNRSPEHSMTIEEPVSISVQTSPLPQQNETYSSNRHTMRWSCNSEVFRKQLKAISSLKHKADEHRKTQPDLACQEYACTVKRYLYLAAFCTDMDVKFLQSLFNFAKWTADFIRSHYHDRHLAGLCYLVCAAFGVKTFNKQQEVTSENQLSECMSAISRAKNKTNTPSPQASSPDTPQRSPGSAVNAADFPFGRLEPLLKLVEVLSITMSSMKTFNQLLPTEWLPTPIDRRVFGCTLAEVFDYAEDKFTQFESSNES